MAERNIRSDIWKAKLYAIEAEVNLKPQLYLDHEEKYGPKRNRNYLEFISQAITIVSYSGSISNGLIYLRTSFRALVRNIIHPVPDERKQQETAALKKVKEQEKVFDSRIEANSVYAAAEAAYKGQVDQSLRILLFEGKRVVVNDSISNHEDHLRNVKMIFEDDYPKN